MDPTGVDDRYGEAVEWSPAAPRFRPLQLVVSLLVGAVAIWVVSWVLPGVHVTSFEGAVIVAAAVGVLNAVLPPVVAALRLPYTLVLGFLAVLALDAGILLLVSALDSVDFKVDSFGWALLAAVLTSAVSLILEVILGVNDESAYSLRVIERVARRLGAPTRTNAPGILFLEIDGLAAPVLRRAMRDGSTPVLAHWLSQGTHRLIEWEMMRGRPAVYATFSSYDEVAHHSGLERADTLEALRKLDQQLGCVERARRYAPRPYKIVVLSDHGQTQGMTFKQRNGYGLDDLVQRSLTHGTVSGMSGGDEHDAAVGQALQEATNQTQSRKGHDLGDHQAVVFGSGNFGLVYLMEDKRRLTAEEINARHPDLLSTLGEHPHVGFLLIRSAQHGPLAINSRGAHHLADGRIEGDDPLVAFSPNAPAHLLRTDSFEHVADIMVGSFYDPELEEGCAFEELISFHGGLGGPQTRPFILYPVELPAPSAPIVGAAAVHEPFSGWRTLLAESPTPDAVGATP